MEILQQGRIPKTTKFIIFDIANKCKYCKCIFKVKKSDIDKIELYAPLIFYSVFLIKCPNCGTLVKLRER